MVPLYKGQRSHCIALLYSLNITTWVIMGWLPWNLRYIICNSGNINSKLIICAHLRKIRNLLTLVGTPSAEVASWGVSKRDTGVANTR